MTEAQGQPADRDYPGEWECHVEWAEDSLDAAATADPASPEASYHVAVAQAHATIAVAVATMAMV